MSGSSKCFLEWKEEFVSQERGNRVVHYFLKDFDGESVLAIIGTERSVRHMFYVVAEEFVQLYGPENSIHVGYKWRSRREVVDWLTSMLSKQHPGGDQSVLALEVPEFDGSRKTQVPSNVGYLSRNLSGQSSEIVWSGTPWTCGKQLKHFPAFCRNGTKIAIQSFLFVMSKGENHYVAYLEDMYEDKRGLKKVKVRWFHHNKEVKGVVPLKNPHPKEVFITPYSQVISAECIDGPATVLTRDHYQQCLDIFPNALLARVHLCYRQFRSNRVKPYDLSKLRGYFDQPIISCLNSSIFTDPESLSQGVNEEEDDELSPSEEVKPGSKRNGYNSNDYEALYKKRKVKFGLSGKNLLSLKHIEFQPRSRPRFEVDEKIEFLCQDSGLRGCWFKCTVLQVGRKQMKVQYDDLLDEDGYSNLEEWIPVFKRAIPDKHGLRCSGRPTIRPCPPCTQADLVFEVGIAVDAWWSDGWWEGFITGINNSDSDSLQVYFPGENKSLEINKKELRISRDWMGNQWINIEAKPDILSVISREDTEIPIPSSAANELPSSPISDIAREQKPQDCSHNSPEHCIDEKKVEASNNGEKVAMDGNANDHADESNARDCSVPEIKGETSKNCESVKLMEVTS